MTSRRESTSAGTGRSFGGRRRWPGHHADHASRSAIAAAEKHAPRVSSAGQSRPSKSGHAAAGGADNRA